MMSTPVTPQRAHRPTHSYSVSHSQQYRSPNSPASPYTPLSLRSFASSNTSPLTTPASAKNFSYNTNRLSYQSPLVRKDKSFADVAQSWRSRASQNGIKVAEDEPLDQSFSDANDSGFISTEEAFLPPPFLSTRRRRAVSQSQVVLPSANFSSSPVMRRTQPSSPLVSKTMSSSMNHSVTATPPPNRNLAAQHKLKGSFTDPPKPRRREAFAIVPQQSPNVSRATNADVSLDLFDIDENDYEYDEYDSHELPHYDFNVSEKLHEYAPYPILGTAPPSVTVPSFGQPAFSDPFISNLAIEYPAIADSMVPEYRYPQHQKYHQPRQDFSQRQMIPMLNPSMLPVASSTPTQMQVSTPTTSAPIEPPTSCSVCSRANSTRLAILSPCKHPLCSACLTSALNIVGEKDMECMVCKHPVEDFALVSPPAAKDASARSPLGDLDVNRSERSREREVTTAKGKSFFDPLFSSPGSAASGNNGINGLDTAFQFLGLFDEAMDGVRCSTPPPTSGRRQGAGPQRQAQEPVVLRIDNVPWDITPPGIVSWLQQPVERAHVLLDKKGKTLSHAFVEVTSEEIAGAILRGEATISGSRGDIGASRQGRGTVLGRGRRARGVTVTRSSQEELMSALFPSWRGSFDGSRPTLAGLDNSRVVSTLESGLMPDSEIATLLYLIRSPDAHFLKVPSLPFYSLISVLSKFPADVDSRVFWSSNLRDSLYDVTDAAIQVLLKRIEDEKSKSAGGEVHYNMELVEKLVRAGLNCQAFTTQQTAKLLKFLHFENDAVLPNPDASDPTDADDEREEDGDSVEDIRSNTGTPSSVTAVSVASTLENDRQEHDNHDNNAAQPQEADASTSASGNSDSIGDLAREFGVGADVVQALMARLAGSTLR